MIPEEAVEAAANAISESGGMRFDGFWSRIEDLEPEDREYALKEARAALEAAAPHLLIDVLDRLAAVRALVEDNTLADGRVMRAINPDAIRAALGDSK